MTISFLSFFEQVISNPVLAVTVLLTLSVILVNGWTDAPNAIATCVSTRAIGVRSAIIMAAVFNFSPNCLSQLFGKYGDSGFVEYITETRIAAAKEMLEQGDLKVYEIAEKLGYESAFYFSKVFKKVTGLSPREYQQSI